jgi:phosphoribosylformimino-5-aminoimidazole carboxamide ribotide isomerase
MRITLTVCSQFVLREILLRDPQSSSTRETPPVILFPAIDLKNGQCVRLKLGDMAQATVFNDDPAAQARDFEAQGFRYLHMVDLDGAFSGKPENAAAVDAILRAIKIPAQLGGGIRDLATIEAWLTKGVRRVILGTVAVRNPALVREACAKFPGRVAVGIDAKGGKVAVEGWAEASELTALDLARRFEDAGVSAIIFTDIDRDGILKGLNLPATVALARAVRIPVIASGGLASMQDIHDLLAPENAGIEGAITGRALYDGRLDPAAALALMAERKPR